MAPERYAHAIRSLYFRHLTQLTKHYRSSEQCECSFAPHSHTESVLRGRKTNNKETAFEGREKGRREMREIKCFLCIHLRNLIAISYLVGCRILAIRERK